MTVINSINASSVGRLSALQATQQARIESTADDIPSATSVTELIASLELPELPLSQRGISIDTLLTAISDADRRNSIQQAVNSIEIKGEDLKTENNKKLAALKEKIDELKKQSFWNSFCKVFKVIGMIAGAIAAAATTLLGAATGNPLLIAAGVIGFGMLADSVVSMATDGKVSIAAGIQKACQAMGFSEETSKWIAVGVQAALIVATIAISLGSSASSLAKVGEAASKATIEGVAKLSSASQITSGVVTAGQGVGTIALAVVSYGISKLEKKSVDIDAILEQLRSQLSAEQDLVEEQMKVAENLITAVKEIIENCSETATAVLTASPSAA